MYDVTVGICCYKQKRWLSRCLRSLDSQSLDKDKFEIIIINDDPDPSKDLQDICDLFENLNIVLINNEKNMGLPASLNQILKKTTGRYFVRVDSDDYVSKHFLYMLSTFLKMNEDYQGIFCDYRKVDKIGRRIAYCNANIAPIACGVMYTYESLCDVGFYNEDFKMREGHELRQRYQKLYKLFHMEIPLYRYRIHSENRTKDKNKLKNYDKMLYNASSSFN